MTWQVIDAAPATRDKRGLSTEAAAGRPQDVMHRLVPAVLLLVALIHALPLAGVLSAAALQRLYGLPVDNAPLELLLRHRAVLFGLLAAFLAHAAFRPALHGLALMAAVVSVGTFLVLGLLVGPLNRELTTVFRVDLVALVLLGVATGVHLRRESAAA